MSITIADLTNKVTPDGTDILHLRETGGIGKKITYSNLFAKIEDDVENSTDIYDAFRDAMLAEFYVNDTPTVDKTYTDNDMGLMQTDIYLDAGIDVTLPNASSTNKDRRVTIFRRQDGTINLIINTGLDFGTPGQSAGTLSLEGNGADYQCIMELISDGTDWRLATMFDGDNNWKRTADGIQECWERFTSVAAGSLVTSGSFNYYLGSKAWTYPKTFATTTDLTINANFGYDSGTSGHAHWCNTATFSTSSVTFRLGGPHAYSSGDNGLHCRAIGRWHT
jgi:hypothetical protein